MPRSSLYPNVVCIEPESFERDLASINSSTVRVVCDRDMEDAQHARTARALEACPGASVQLGGWRSSVQSIECLRHYSDRTEVSIDWFRTKSLDALRHLNPRLKSLSIGPTSSKRISLEGIRRFTHLRKLSVDGQIDVLHHFDCFPRLEALYLRGVGCSDLRWVDRIPRLWWLWHGLCSTKSLEGIERAANLQYMELWLIKGLSDLVPIGNIDSLEELKLESLSRVGRLPCLSRLTKLRGMELTHMKALRDLSPIVQSKSIEDLYIWNARHHRPEDFRCLVGHASLRFVSLALGSDRKNKAVHDMLGLPARPPGSGLRWVAGWDAAASA